MADLTPKEKISTYLEFYKEHCTHGRHTETQRQTVTTFLFAAAGGLVALMGALHFSIQCLPIALLLFSLGVFGSKFVKVYEIKWDETAAKRRLYRQKILSLLEEGDCGSSASAKTTTVRLRTYWRRAFMGVWIASLVCIVLIVGVFFARYWSDQPHNLCTSFVKQVLSTK